MTKGKCEVCGDITYDDMCPTCYREECYNADIKNAESHYKLTLDVINELKKLQRLAYPSGISTGVINEEYHREYSHKLRTWAPSMFKAIQRELIAEKNEKENNNE